MIKDLKMKKDDPMTASILERTAAIRILLYLYDNVDRPDGVYLTEIIRHVVASSETIMLTIDTLLKHGLIKDEYKKEYPFKRMFMLTDLGLEVAKPLAAVDNALRSQAPQEQKSNH